MHQFGHIERWLVLVACLVVPLAAGAQTQGNAMLSFSMDATSSISLVFNSYAPGAGVCQLSNSGTNSVGLNLGWANGTGGHGGCPAYSHVGTTYTVSTPFYLDVEVSNSTSTSYALQVWVTPAPPANAQYLLNGVQLPSVKGATQQAHNAYGNTTETFGVTVANSVTAQTFSFVANFQATAN